MCTTMCREAATTLLSNAMVRLSQRNRVHIEPLPEYPKGIGAVAAVFNVSVDSSRFLAQLTRTLDVAGVPSWVEALLQSSPWAPWIYPWVHPWSNRTFLEGHTFYHDNDAASGLRVATPSSVAVIGTARDPYQRLASGYEYTREVSSGLGLESLVATFR